MTLPTINRSRMLENFLTYVKVDTTAKDDTDHYPSSPGQLELGKILLRQLQELGLSDAHQDEYGIVMATIPSNLETSAPTIAFNSHVDTSPETTGANVKPHVIESYAGGDIVLSGDSSKVITESQCPELKDAIGKTIITTDGTTLLGGDDKAGVAIIMELAATLLENPEVPRGEIRVLFTCDEEIGRGPKHVDIEQVNAVACYTFDGGGQNDVDVETFSADGALVKIQGVNIHPAIAKDKMINAVRATADFLQRLPAELSPERMDGRDGFLHPYVIDGGVAEVNLKVLLRSFDTSELSTFAELLKKCAAETEQACAGTSVEVEVTKQYRNMADGLEKEPRAAEFALQAHRNLGREPNQSIIRGGTDGSQFTERGLPTPNLSSGQHNIHSPLEWACLDEMVAACEIGLEIVRLWSETD